jgi:hypothetical protein
MRAAERSSLSLSIVIQHTLTSAPSTAVGNGSDRGLRSFASCTTAEPTPPDAPATSTCSPLFTPARANVFSAVPRHTGSSRAPRRSSHTGRDRSPMRAPPQIARTRHRSPNPSTVVHRPEPCRTHARRHEHAQPMLSITAAGPTATTRPPQIGALDERQRRGCVPSSVGWSGRVLTDARCRLLLGESDGGSRDCLGVPAKASVVLGVVDTSGEDL